MRCIYILICTVFIVIHVPAAIANKADNLYKDFKEYRKDLSDSKKSVFPYFDDKIIYHALSSLLLVRDENVLHNKRAIGWLVFFGDDINYVYYYKASCANKNDCVLVIIFKKNPTGDFYKTGIHYESNWKGKLKNVSHLISGVDFYIDKINYKSDGKVIDNFSRK